MKNKIIKITLLLIVVLLGVIGLAASVEENVSLQTAKVTNNAANNSQSSYNINVETPWQISNQLQYMRIKLRRTNRQGFSYYDAIPMYDKDPSIKLYCIEPGARVSFRHYGYEYDNYRVITTKEELMNSGYKEYYMTPIYNSVGIFQLPVAASYILSAEDKETNGEYIDIYCDGKNNRVWLNADDAKWLEKQRGIWRLCKNTASNGYRLDMIYPYGIGEKLILTGDKSIFGGKASIYDTEAKNYTEYDLKVRNKGLQPKDNTNIKAIETEFNDNLCTAGPFKISYTNGIYGKVAFAGISKVSIIGLDADKKEVEELSIKNYYLKNSKGKYDKISADSMYFFSGDNEYKIDRLNGNEKYIKSGQDFKVELEYPNNTNVVYAKLRVEFKYMLANGEYNKLKGMEYYIWDGVFGETKNQTLIAADADRTIYTEVLELQPVEVKLPSLGGNVWEDGLANKESVADGKNNTTNDIPLPNVKVTLYTADGKLAVLQGNPNQTGISNEDIMHRVNPTYTDKNGNYLFEGIYPGKQYYVVFEYDGQIYMPTKKISPEEQNTSKGLEKANERTEFNNRFAEIRSYPENYKTTNSLGKNLGTYNKVYTQYELMGYTLDENGKYKKTGTQLIDGYLYDENGNQTETYSQGEVSTKILEYIYKNKKSPNIKDIYSSIAGNNTEMWRKLQYIEDCKIKSYTDKYTATSQYKDYINQGLYRRPEGRLILTKDVLYGATRINGKTEIYGYNNRENSNWEIQTRMQNYAQYYGGAYVNGVYQSDLIYDGRNVGNTNNLLEVYVTYKITVKNASQSILTQIPEVVDYYDKNYTFMKDLSWVMFVEKDKSEVNLSEKSYYNMIDSLSLKNIPNAKNVNSSEESRYGKNTQQNISNETNAIYIEGLEKKKLTTGEQAYIYLTFKVNKKDITENDNVYANYAEINGYKTFYANGTELPNNDKIKNDTTVAGIIDRKSVPGNLSSADLSGKQHEKNFENDTDRAKGINVKQNEGNRVINGTVWEDKRTKKFSNVAIGDGVRDDNEKGIQGVIVELLEILEDGTEYVWQTAYTDVNGYYQFPPRSEENSKGIIPGNYIVRFRYGASRHTAVTSENGGQNEVAYNGQDYKSTVYQKDMLTNTNLEKDKYDIVALDNYGKNLSDAKDLWEDKQVTIKQANTTNEQKVTLQGRQTVNNYSKTLTNAKSEVLASPYKTNATDDEIKKLIDKTHMVAETAVISIEGEYNRTESRIDDKNGVYVLANVDFGLTERPKAQLELNKKVTHIKIRLANGNVLFDSKQATNNLIWQAAEDYNLDINKYTYKDDILKLVNRNGIIQITMDEELMHGATIEISYSIQVKNVSETDYLDQEFYYKGIIPNNATMVTTAATQVLDYVSNNLQFNTLNNNGWNAINLEAVIKNGLVNQSVSNKLNKTNVILQADMSKELKPGEKTDNKQLLLTQVITSQNNNDDLTYENVAEIVQVANTAGRRMVFSILGNQDPTQSAMEVDTSSAEQVLILPPFGEDYLYLSLALVVVTMLASGVVLIKKFVLC